MIKRLCSNASSSILLITGIDSPYKQTSSSLDNINFWIEIALKSLKIDSASSHKWHPSVEYNTNLIVNALTPLNQPAIMDFWISFEILRQRLMRYILNRNTQLYDCFLVHFKLS